MAVCRVCKKHESESDLIKYGVRHYAHADCYFAAGHSIDGLRDWQIRSVPYLILKKYGLLNHPLVRTVTEQIDAEIAARVA